jgi:hypothetical protein
MEDNSIAGNIFASAAGHIRGAATGASVPIDTAKDFRLPLHAAAIGTSPARTERICKGNGVALTAATPATGNNIQIIVFQLPHFRIQLVIVNLRLGRGQVQVVGVGQLQKCFCVGGSLSLLNPFAITLIHDIPPANLDFFLMVRIDIYFTCVSKLIFIYISQGVRTHPL